MIMFLMKPFHRRFAIKHCNDDVSVVSGLLRTYQGQITVQNTGVDHGVTTDLRKKQSAPLTAI